MTDSLPLIYAVNLQDDSDLENYITSVQKDMMEFKLSYEMWRVGRWAVSIPQVSYKYRSVEAVTRLVLGCRVHV